MLIPGIAATPELSVLGVEAELALTPTGEIPALLGRLRLRRMGPRRPVVTLADHGPPLPPKLDVHRGLLRHLIHFLSFRSRGPPTPACGRHAFTPVR